MTGLSRAVYGTFFWLAAAALAQTPVWLRTGPPGSAFRITGASNTDPIVVTAPGHDFSDGQVVYIHNVRGNLAANGLRKVIRSNPAAGTFALADLNGRSVPGSGSYIDSGFVGPVAQFTLRNHPRVLFDGPDGPFTAGLPTKAVSNNIPYQALLTYLERNLSESYYRSLARVTSDRYAGYPGEDWRLLPVAALLWRLDRNRTEALALVKYFLTNAERLAFTFGCKDDVTQCGRGAWLDVYQSMVSVAMAYTLVRSELTPAERAQFAAKILNDVTRMDPSTGTYSYEPAACANSLQPAPGALTAAAGSNTALGSGTNLAPGDVIQLGGTLYWVTAVQGADPQTITVSRNFTTTPSGASFWKASPWKPGDCGWLWMLKHHKEWPRALLAYGGGNHYAPDGAGATQTNALSNHTIARIYGTLALGVALADDDERARDYITAAHAYFLDVVWDLHSQYWSGPAITRTHYLFSRVWPSAIDIAIILRHSFTSLPFDFAQGDWAKRTLLFQLFHQLPHRNETARYGQRDASASNNGLTQFNAAYRAWYLYPDSPETRFSNTFVRKLFTLDGKTPAFSASNFGGSALYPFLFADPRLESTPLSKLPTQHLFRQTDRSDYPTRNLSVMISRTGWPDGPRFTADTWTWLWAADNRATELGYRGYAGDYHIVKGDWLLSGDYGPDNCSPTTSCRVNDSQFSNSIEIGGANNQRPNGPSYDPEISRYAGDPESRYAYALADLTNVYLSSVAPLRLLRHFLHLKKPGAQDFIIVYDDLTTASPQLKRIFLHYPQNGGSGEGNTRYADGVIFSHSRSSSLITRILLPASPAVLTDVGVVLSGATLTVCKNASPEYPYVYRARGVEFRITQPATITLNSSSPPGTAYLYLTQDGRLTLGHSGLSLTLTGIHEALGVTEFPPDAHPIEAFSAIGTPPKTRWSRASVSTAQTLTPMVGQTRRFLISDGLTTQSEFLVVHQPRQTLEGDVPQIQLLTSAEERFRGVQILGSHPKVALFARGGLTYNSLRFSTSFQGVAQILIAGLAPGAYSVEKDGATLLAQTTVEDGNHVLYLEAESGNFSVLPLGGPPPLAIQTTTLPEALVGAPFFFTFTASGGAPPYLWSLASGTLPEGLALNSEGVLGGLPAAATTAWFTVEVRDSSDPPLTARKSFSLTVQEGAPSALQIVPLEVSSSSAWIRYGRSGLGPANSCTLLLTTDPGFENPLETFTDNGGPEFREYLFGEQEPLSPETAYYVKLTCGEESATAEFTTAPAP